MNETTSPTTSTTKVETTKPTTSTTNSTTETKTTSDIPITTTSPRSQTTDTQTPSRTLIPFPTDKEELSSNEQNFIDIFYATYEKYFFVDEPQAYCKKIGQMKAQDLVNTLLMVGNTSGFIIPRQTDLSVFATDLVNACADGNMTSKASTFKTRFDTTYPF
jgi:hypothetical protein